MDAAHTVEAGRARWARFFNGLLEKQIVVGQSAETAVFHYEYNGDHLSVIEYPDSELVTHTYDQSGQPTGLISSTAGAYVENITYDVRGRPRVLARGNMTTDTLTYHDKSRNFALGELRTHWGASTTQQHLMYSNYTDNGQVSGIIDSQHPTGTLSNTATFTYDGPGRLRTASGVNFSFQYDYDVIGNMTLKEGRSFQYNPSASPHRLIGVNGSSYGLDYDENGNLASKNGVLFQYDGHDRLIEVGGISMLYDYSGRKVAEVNGASVRRYFNDQAESHNGTLFKYYHVAGMRVARTKNAGWANIAAERNQNRLLLAWIGRSSASFVPIAVSAFLLGLVAFPGPRRRALGNISVADGHVIVLLIAWSTAALPIVPRRAAAGGGGGPPPTTEWHYHFDHLGSTQLITDQSGVIIRQLRYDPFGRVRYQTGTSPADGYEFTGYESEPVAGLQYAGARFYDPDIGMFLTHDPLREFANPYSYTGWDPVNATDPGGTLSFKGALGDFMRLMSAGDTQVPEDGDVNYDVVGGVVMLVAGVGFGSFVPQAVFASPAGQAVGWTLLAASIGSQTYTAVQGFRTGNYDQAIVGVLGLGLTFASLAASFGGAGAYGSSSGGGPTGKYQGRVLFQGEIDELDALFHGRTPPDWYQVVVDNQAGFGGREYTWGNTIHMGGKFSMRPISAGTEQFALLAHEAAHVVDFAASFGRTLAGASSDQIKYFLGGDVYNPAISGAPLSSYSVEGRATLYEWAYRLNYPQIGYGTSNFPRTPAGQRMLYDTLYP